MFLKCDKLRRSYRWNPFSVRKGVHDDIDSHLNGFFIILPAECEAVTIAPSAVNVGGTQENSKAVIDKNTSGAVVLALHDRQAASLRLSRLSDHPGKRGHLWLHILHMRQTRATEVVHVMKDLVLARDSFDGASSKYVLQ